MKDPFSAIAMWFSLATLAVAVNHTQCFTVTNYGATNITNGSLTEMLPAAVPAFHDGKPTEIAGKALREQLSNSTQASKALLNSSDETTFQIGGGNGTCGPYDSYKTLGACVFSGTDQSGTDPLLGGWVSRSQTANCGRKIVAWKEGQAPVEMSIADGCTFIAPTDAAASCPDIAFTVAAFLAVAGSQQTEALNRGTLENVHWKFLDEPL